MHLYPVDLARFWKDNQASLGKPFRTDKPQVPMTLKTHEGCIWDELGIPFTKRIFEDDDFRLSLVRQYNDKAEEIIGRRILSEASSIPKQHRLRHPNTIRELFGCEIVILDEDWMGPVEWANPTISTPAELEARLEQVEATDLESFVFPPGWHEALARLRQLYGKEPEEMHSGGVRGPITAAMSMVGVENFILWLHDYPPLMDRFRDLLAEKIVAIETLVRKATGMSMHGFKFYDDNCCLLNPEMYERFGYPIVKHVFSVFSPDENDRRYQHSDSEMSHIMPALHRAGLNEANFGPTVDPRQIRRVMPRTVIHGQLPPFTFSRGTPEEIYAAVLRDLEWVGGDGGLVVQTAGSVNAGSKLAGLRAAMAAIQQHGRYQPLD